MFLLSPEQVQLFLKHPYARGGTTFLDPIANPFYNWLAEFIPRWITPNAITFAGGFCVVMMLYLVLFVDRAERWMYLSLTILQFLATTLDGCDGKHARNTKQSSAVGAWVDHALDAFACPTFCVMNWLAVEGNEKFPMVMYGSASILLSWYAVHWEEACTQKEHFPFFADIEASTLNSLFLLQAYIWGPGNPMFSDIMFLVFVAGIAVNLFYALRGILRVKATGASNLHFDLLFPMVVYSCLWLAMGFTDIYHQHLVATKLILIFAFALISARLILSNLAFDPANPHKEFRSFAKVFNISLAAFQVIHTVNYFVLGLPSAPYMLLAGVGLLLGYCHTFFSVYVQILQCSAKPQPQPQAADPKKEK